MDPAKIHARHDELRRRADGVTSEHPWDFMADSYYDTRVKTAKQFDFVSRYIEQNPVVKGLIETPEEWDASSAKHRNIVTEPWPWWLDE